MYIKKDAKTTFEQKNARKTLMKLTAGKFVFRLDGQEVESSECSDSKVIQINPNFVSIFGGLPVEFSGPCVNESSNIEITFFDIRKGERKKLTCHMTSLCTRVYVFVKIYLEIKYQISSM